MLASQQISSQSCRERLSRQHLHNLLKLFQLHVNAFDEKRIEIISYWRLSDIKKNETEGSELYLAQSIVFSVYMWVQYKKDEVTVTLSE